MEQNIDTRLANRLTQLRRDAGWSLDELASRSGIPKATLSRLERGETSPTASLLGRLCAAHGRPMSRLLAEVEAEPALLIRAADQPVWTDPATGFVRRSLSPPASGLETEMIHGTMPAGTIIDYDAPPVPGLEQHIWLLEGRLEYRLDGVAHVLEPGDVLRFRLYGATRFHSLGDVPARYIIAITRP
ncbi:helix-turn-helix domain-containing protein [Niveispirillum sp. KHB5.9]|uniref:helix-turn-helix domain-containing protein n=1 Tax=Niveispirillum sp. KHB5.9 TaxID=3400269 RepID=UPI003A8548C0